MESDPQAANILSQLAVLLILTIVNAFFAGSEMAVVSVNKNKIHRLAEQGNKNAALIERLMEDSTVFLSTIQVAITLAGFFSSASAATGIAQVLGGAMAERGIPYSQSIASVLVTIILAYFNLVFGELVPKRIALQKAEGFSLLCVRPIYMISRVMSPFIKLLSLSTSGVLKLIGMHSETLESDVSEEEIKSMLETGSEKGVFNDIEKEMITSIFSFDDKRAREVMVPRQDMVTIDISEPVESYIDEILQSMHSKIPVYEDEIDNIIGILSTKNLMIQIRKCRLEDLDIRSMLSEPYFVPENRRTDALFKEMQKNKNKIAILIDEYGGVSGMVTLEDLIEEIVGDIHEEYEDVEPDILEIEPHKIYRVSGSISLFDLNEEMHLHIDSTCDTLSGYLMELLGYIPDQEKLPLLVETPEADYEVESMDDRVIDKVKLTLKEKKGSESQEEEE
ncbi:MAG TPA: hemolysin family protein [Candidatus Enterocloster excrementipullorum]|uniref:Hemolysin family protein n=1 Tax=Candidatus Enterocloster excrementipullorum TaxID=2838559 RepID=A0A9D2N091_9FIRM|nr:hemolysin family protein [Candidatus Enterocloster excrementipullorum]